MLFSSMTFLFIFLPVLLFLYYIVKPQFRNTVLLIASLIFYGWGEPRYLFVMLLIILNNYIGAILIDNYRKYAKFILFLATVCNLVNLIYFKYTNFIIENINALFHGKIDFIHVIMPIGISFYTFQALSYLVDVYRKDCPVQRNFYDLLLYVILFPQLIAGPIVKYHDIVEQISCRQVDFENFVCGLKRFIAGLGKKVIIANTMGGVVEKIFILSPEQFSPLIAWSGIICYTFQLYYDFSGYSDMAIGLGRMFGFRFLENFNYPYISSSITEFWRRWHISMSTWFKEYLYIPLGGNRVSPLRNYFNLFIVFLATGIWHGASWNFIFWGLWHGIFIIFEKLTGLHKTEKNIIKSIFLHLYTILVFVIGWVMFRAENMTYAVKYIGRMFNIGEQKANVITVLECFDNFTLIIMVIALICSFPIFRNFTEKYNGFGRIVHTILCNIYLLAIFILSAASIAEATFNPFIYFRF